MGQNTWRIRIDFPRIPKFILSFWVDITAIISNFFYKLFFMYCLKKFWEWDSSSSVPIIYDLVMVINKNFWMMIPWHEDRILHHHLQTNSRFWKISASWLVMNDQFLMMSFSMTCHGWYFRHHFLSWLVMEMEIFM